jgi:transposase
MAGLVPRPSGSILIDEVHGIDSSWIQTFWPTFWFQPESNAMPLQATVFSRLLQHVPWAAFEDAVASHKADKGCRTLDARSHLAALMVGQLIEAHGLRDIEAVLAMHASALRRRGIEPACRSTLSDANAARSAAPFEALITALLGKLSPTKARYAHRDLRLVDSTLVRPGAAAADWAQFQKGCVAAKVHVVYDPKNAVPTFFELTSANTNDITVAKAMMPLAAGATYVFDLGYYDFGFWADLDARGCRFVTRVKKNTPLTLVRKIKRDGDGIVSDRIVRLPQRLASRRTNPFAKPGRAIKLAIEGGRRITLFTNDLTSPATTIAELYKTRWQIELFFRWIKQNLRIRRFHGRSYNAVRLQIAAAIIVYLLLKLAHRDAKTRKTPAVFFASLRAALFHRLDLDSIVQRIERRTPKPNLSNTPQLALAL